MVKIEFTPLSLDRKIFPFKKGFKKRTFPSDFVELGSEIILDLFLAENGRLFCFVATLYDFGLLFFS